jgi:hypothetical protein
MTVIDSRRHSSMDAGAEDRVSESSHREVSSVHHLWLLDCGEPSLRSTAHS